MTPLAQFVGETGTIPLVWAGSTTKMDYLNFGDALSPVMVALCTGLGVERIPSRAQTPRLVAVGTIGHGIEGGTAWIWGSGCSPHKNPVTNDAEKIPYTVPADTRLEIAATRGPVTRRLMSNGDAPPPGAVYGDPVWLLPQFYRPSVPKRWDLGVILHLSELSDRAFEAHVLPQYRRYAIPDDFRDTVHLINTVTPIEVGALRTKIDEILACRRIVSTSLHGMVIAESYGIPCLYFSPHGGNGLITKQPTVDSGLDLRIVDLYSGLGVAELPVYAQPRGQTTDWAALIAAIDHAWQPVSCREDDLLAALPLPVNRLTPPPGQTVFDHPLLQGLKLQHDVGELNRLEKLRSNALAAKRVKAAPPAPAPVPVPVPTRARRGASLQAVVAAAGSVPLAWVATTDYRRFCNLGDALSPVIVAALAGLPIQHRRFDEDCERLVSVGTIGHAQKNGIVHFWGTGLDAKRNPMSPEAGPYRRPDHTEFVVHALRGPNTGEVLRRQGIAVPAVYGDPVWFLPRLMPAERPAPTYALGVIVHISELDGVGTQAAVLEAFQRYRVPEALAASVRIINTWTDPSVPALFDKVEEILTCKRIASTSLHGLVIAETFGRPCVWFGTRAGGPEIIDLPGAGTSVDHRVHDFYAGAGKTALPIYCHDRTKPTDWEALIDWIDRSWAPLDYDGAALFESFPIDRAVTFADRQWSLPPGLDAGLRL